MKIKTRFILPLSIVYIAGILIIVIFSDIRKSRQDINKEKQIWISLGETLARSWKSTMRFTGSDNLARDQFYQEPLDNEINRKIVRNPRLTRINPESSPYASTDLEMRVINEGQALSQIVGGDSSRKLLTLVPLIAEQECIICHQQENKHDLRVGEVMGIIELTTSVDQVYTQIAQDRYIMITGMTIVFLIGLIIIYYVTKRLTEPITQLTESSQKIAAGNLDVKINIKRKDELGLLGNAFNIMTKNLRESRRNIEEALRRAEKADKVKTLFLENMSHEIRTPLNAILGFTDLIRRSTQHLLNPEEQTFFDTIKRSGERLMHTIHEILDISQIESGTLELDPKTLDLKKLLQDIVQDFQHTAKDKDLELLYSPSVDRALIVADKHCITQALTSLIDNALKYTEKGSVDVTITSKNREIIVTIKDTGIGMSPKYLKRLYEVFSQESTGYTKKYQGVGLGLALTKRYLDINDVRITVRSKKGEGTIFILTFKPAERVCHSNNTTNDESMTKLPQQTTKKPLILVVEDDVNSQKLNRYFLKDFYNLLFASSINEAKDRLKKNKIELILLDLSLSGDEDGLDLARYLRKTKEWKNIPIIALTAHAFTKDRDNCLSAGCNTYLSKPVKQQRLLEVIAQFV